MKNSEASRDCGDEGYMRYIWFEVSWLGPEMNN